MPTPKSGRAGGGAPGGGGGPRLAVRVGAGLGALFAIASEILGGAANVLAQGRKNIALGFAEFDYWAAAGANPVYGVYQLHGRKPLDPKRYKPEANVVFSSIYPYVADIDVKALAERLPERLHSYQEFTTFLDAGIEIGVIRVEKGRFYAMVNQYSRAKMIVYNITDVIERVRREKIAETEKVMRDNLRGFSPEQMRKIARLKKRNRTPLYRAAHGPLILTSTNTWLGGELFGPDPWVVPVGREVGWSLRFAHGARVMVTPANADAWRGALNSAYVVKRKLEDALAEVRDSGRQILEKHEGGGRLESFVAGPDSGPSARFGVTRYRRHPASPFTWSAAVGELKRFWVDKDQLVTLAEGEAKLEASKSGSAK